MDFSYFSWCPEVLHNKWKSREIIIPPFQRRFVWKQAQASKLIESFLLDLPVPPIFLYEESDGKLMVIDGQQRLKSVFSFFDGVFESGESKATRSSRRKKPFKLVGLHEQSRFNNKGTSKKGKARGQEEKVVIEIGV